MPLFGSPNVEKLAAKGNVKGIVKALGYKKDPSVCQAAAEALDELGWQPEQNETGALYWAAKRQWNQCVDIGTPAVKPLIGALEDVDKDVRQAAARALGQIGDAQAVKSLIAALKDTEENVRVTAVLALGRIGDAQAVDPLISALKDTDGNVREAAAKALGQIRDARAVEPLNAALKDEWPHVRQAANGALEQIHKEIGQDDLDAIREYWRHLAQEWWQTESRTEAICDACSYPISKDGGYLHGTYLLCEKCCDKRVGPDCLEDFREDPSHLGMGLITKARGFVVYKETPREKIKQELDEVFRTHSLAMIARLHSSGQSMSSGEMIRKVTDHAINRASEDIMNKYGLSMPEVLELWQADK